jgi:hypothetical protein
MKLCIYFMYIYNFMPYFYVMMVIRGRCVIHLIIYILGTIEIKFCDDMH